jgi:hypothetical protein
MRVYSIAYHPGQDSWGMDRSYETSVVHKSDQSANGMYWRWPWE